jgi:hypothetical protein
MNGPTQPDDWRPAQPRVRRPHVYAAIGTLAGLAILAAFVGGGTPSLYYYFTSFFYDAPWALDSVPLSAPPFAEDAPPDDTPLDTRAVDIVEPALRTRLVARDAEAIDAGFEVLQPWSEVEMAPNETNYVSFVADVEHEYAVLARTTEICDVDAIIDDNSQDVSDSSDATLQFYVNEVSDVTVALQVYASNAGTCLVGYGVYRR